jgi:uncharacterized protein
VKIDINKVPPDGVTLVEEFTPQALDLETEIIKLRGPIKVRAEVSRIFNVVTVHLSLTASIRTSCSRCLEEFETLLKRNLEFNYPVNNLEPVLDLDPEIREEIILDYPIKPLCSSNCKGLCAKCGKNLNEGGCSCGIT